MRILAIAAVVGCGGTPRPAPIEPVAPVVTPPAPVVPAKAVSQIPTATSPCDDVKAARVPDLVAVDARHPLLCWGDDCVWSGEPVKRPPERMMILEYEARSGRKLGTAPVTTVAKDAACAAGHCEPFGPKLQAAIADRDDAKATADLEAIVVGSEVWSRTKDAPIAIPAMKGDPPGLIEVIGERLAVGYSCNEYCADTARVFDSRGRLVGPATFAMGSAPGYTPAPIDLAGDRYLVWSQFGDVTLVAGGVPVASTHVGAEGGIAGDAPVMARVTALPLGSEDVALEVCTPIGCQLANLRVGEWPAQGRTPASTHLDYHVARQLPRCSLEPPSY